MTDTLYQIGWYIAAGTVVTVALLGLARQQWQEVRIRRRLDRRIRSLRRR